MGRVIDRGVPAASGWSRRLALFAGLGLVGAFLRSLHHITAVVGGTGWLALAVGASFAASTLAARRLSLRQGLGVGAVLFAAGLCGYLLVLPDPWDALVSLRLLGDLVALVANETSLLQNVRADLWAIAMAPAPVFTAWYALVRGRYGLGALVGGVTLGFFALTGDATETAALVGGVCLICVLAFGSLVGADVSWGDVRDLGLRVAAVVVVTRLARPVTAGLVADRDGSGSGSRAGESDAPSGPPTLESGLVDVSNRVDVRGRISLSPAVRFTVAADRPSFWHVAAYDRFAGDAWVRTGEPTDYDGPQSAPPGETRRVRQTVNVESATDAMPAAWKPVGLDGGTADRTRVTSLGGLRPAATLPAGESYSVTSERPRWTVAGLRETGGEDPASVRDRFLQVPASTPDRVARLAADLTSDADGRFETATVLERWLAETKDYSLAVDRPDGDVADAFAFEMDAGYCVYFATTMAVLLRTLDVPARFAVGYTTGQRVADGEWVVRGFNSHAWVEVFFPGVGWVPFDPTPSGPRQAARGQRLAAARAADLPGIDTDRTRPTPTPAPTPAGEKTGTTVDTASRSGDESPTATPTVARVDEQRGAVQPNATGTLRWRERVDQSTHQGGGVGRRELFADLSGTDRVTVLAGIVGAALGVARLGVLRRGYRLVSLYWQPATDSPRADVERAFDRLETAMARAHRPRRPGETRREYVGALRAAGYGSGDGRLAWLLATYERARYGGEVSRDRADRAIALVDDIVRSRLFDAGAGDERLGDE